MLRAVADQVAGAVQISNAKKDDDDDKERMKLLRDASAEMLRIALQNEDNFWLTVLTIATANFGLGFNRALLFLRQENDEVFLGRAGIGTNNREEAVRHWKRDEKQKHNFKDFLKHLEDGSVRHTPFHEMVIGIKIQKDEIGASLQETLQAGQMLSLTASSISESLPGWLISQFSLGECAVLPIMSVQSALGFLIVDNKHNQNPLNSKALGSLQSLLYNAGLVKEILRQREKSEDLLDANLEISSVSRHQSLKTTLNRIGKTAFLIGQADWAIIHPFEKDKKPYQIDVNNVGSHGTLRNATIEELTNSKPNVGGISRHVLRKGELIVENINHHDPSIGRLKLSEHHFIKSEGVKALIGEAVKDPFTRNILGILYLDYRTPHKFSYRDKHHARALANLAAIAISNEREITEIKQKRQFQLASDIAEAVGASLDLEDTIGAILGNLRKSFGETQLCVLLYDKRLNALKFAPGALKYYKIANRKLIAKKDGFLLDQDASIACRVARETLAKKRACESNVHDVSKDGDYLKLNPKVKSEFCISMLNSKNELLGVLALEREQLEAFSRQDIEVIKTVAMHISIAIERAQQKEDLEYKSLVSARTSWAANMAHGINSEVFNIRSWAYLIQKKAENGSEIELYAKNIEECADQLVSINPWSSRPSETVEINHFLAETLYPIAESKGILVELQYSSPTATALIKVAQFKNVLKLLTNNASKAMKKPEEKKILVSTRLTGDNKIEITFKDFGPGIDKKLHASALRKPITTKGIGGYGLLFARQMIEDMQGEIVLAPFKEGEGATFIIHLPATSNTSKQSEGQ
jgi:GAF domain-containing protein